MKIKPHMLEHGQVYRWNKFQFDLEWNSTKRWWDINLNRDWELRRRIDGLSETQVCDFLNRTGTKLVRTL